MLCILGTKDPITVVNGKKKAIKELTFCLALLLPFRKLHLISVDTRMRSVRGIPYQTELFRFHCIWMFFPVRNY